MREMGHSSTIWLTFQEKTDAMFMKISSQLHFWTRKSSINFRIHPDLESDSRSGLRTEWSPWRRLRFYMFKLPQKCVTNALQSAAAAFILAVRFRPNYPTLLDYS